jgi:putative ABC transport system ATP-binding protein
MKPLIKLLSVKKQFPMDGVVVKALRGVDLEIKSSEFVAIVGPSGSGKSTLMNIIGLLDRPTKGTYIFSGQKTSRFSDNKLASIRNSKIGFIFQTFNLLPRLSALENVKMPLMYKDNTQEKSRKALALEKLKQVGLEDRVEHRPNQLSGGQQQKVAIARALINKPDLILADEPTGNLDSKSGKEIMDIITRLHKKKNTIILVSHDLKLAKMAQRIIHIKDGQIIKDEKI